MPGTPGIDWGIVLMLGSLAVFIVAFTMGGLNYVTTVLQARCRGMTLMRMPLSIWGLFTATVLGLLAFPALLVSAIMMLFAHGLISGLLFLVVGVVYDRAHHRDLNRFGGLMWNMPTYAAIASLAMFASLGLPGLAGFWGEFMALLGAYNPLPSLAESSLGIFRTSMVLGAIGTVLTAGYMLWMLQKVAFGKPKAEFEGAHIHDVNVYEWAQTSHARPG